MSDKDRNYDLQVEKQCRIETPQLAYKPLQPEQTHRIVLIDCGGISESHLKAYQRAGGSVVAFADVECDRAVARRDAFYPEGETLPTIVICCNRLTWTWSMLPPIRSGVLRSSRAYCHRDGTC